MTSSIVGTCTCISTCTCTLAVVKRESYDHLCSEVVGYSAMRIQQVRGTLHIMYMHVCILHVHVHYTVYSGVYVPINYKYMYVAIEFLNSSTYNVVANKGIQ